MRTLDIITRKRDGLEHSSAEIEHMVSAFVQGEMPDYQMAAWLMAIFFRGMTHAETAALTLAMAHSGQVVNLSAVPGIKVDKHSTGGVGDTTTLVIGPLAAAAGVPVAKMSGRGLGFTGGTIDKLESIPGFRTTLAAAEFLETLHRHGIALTGQSKDVAPADGKMYALRDVTGTVESIPLIASSIMSKKIAAGADKILLDVKVGSGAFMKTLDDAVKLAEQMVQIGDIVGRETSALITNMAEPLGRAVGNSVEVAEALSILSGRESGTHLYQVCMALAVEMLVLARKAIDRDVAASHLAELLASGAALAKFREFIVAQGGDPAFIEHPERLPQASLSAELRADKSGCVAAIDTEQVGRAVVLLGAGREYKGQQIDLSAGLLMNCRVGDCVETGQPLVSVYSQNPEKLSAGLSQLREAIKINSKVVEGPPLILGMVDSRGFHPARID